MIVRAPIDLSADMKIRNVEPDRNAIVCESGLYLPLR